jgi:zinc D-Ala-D-Ala carboxypeptidase
MMLSRHFALNEFVESATARAHGIDNTPPPEVMPRLIQLADLLERIRSTLDVPLYISSGYRCPRLNSAVGGVPDSDHEKGDAADFTAPGFGDPHAICILLAPLVSTLGIGQLIHEGPHNNTTRWVHVSTRTPANAVNRILTITAAGPQPGIHAIA